MANEEKENTWTDRKSQEGNKKYKNKSNGNFRTKNYSIWNYKITDGFNRLEMTEGRTSELENKSKEIIKVKEEREKDWKS